MRESNGISMQTFGGKDLEDPSPAPAVLSVPPPSEAELAGHAKSSPPWVRMRVPTCGGGIQRLMVYFDWKEGGHPDYPLNGELVTLAELRHEAGTTMHDRAMYAPVRGFKDLTCLLLLSGRLTGRQLDGEVHWRGQPQGDTALLRDFKYQDLKVKACRDSCESLPLFGVPGFVCCLAGWGAISLSLCSGSVQECEGAAYT